MKNYPFLLEESVKAGAKQAVLDLAKQLAPGLIELADGQAQRLTPMGDRSYAFVVKALEYARQYPEFDAFAHCHDA